MAGTAAALAVAAAPATGQANPTPTPAAGGVKSKQGSWLADFVTEDGRKFKGFTTFTPNGGLIANGQGDARVDGPQSIGHGRWTQDGRKVEALTYKFMFDAKGTAIGIKETFSTGQLDETGDKYTGSTVAKTFDMNGKLLKTEKGTITAKRLSMESIFPA